jgi:hypothetical protein
MQHNVLVLQVYTTVDLEHVRHELANLLRGIKRWCHWVEEHRLQSFIIISDETPHELRVRVDSLILNRPGIGGAYCFTAPEDLVGNHGEFEGLRFHIDRARLEIRQRNRPDNMRHTQRRVFRNRKR